MNSIKYRKWATPITIGSFIITGITGICMFFEINFGLLRVAHELISLILVIGTIFHIAGNFNAFKHYFKKPISLAGISIFILIGIFAVALPNNHSERKAFFNLTDSMQDVPLTLAAQITKTDPESVQTHLKSHGFDVLNTDQTINEVAALNKKDTQSILAVIFEND